MALVSLFSKRGILCETDWDAFCGEFGKAVNKTYRMEAFIL